MVLRIAVSEGTPVMPTVFPSNCLGSVIPDFFRAISPPSGRCTSAAIAWASRPSEIWLARSMPSAMPKSALPASISFSVSAVEVGWMTFRSMLLSS